MPDRIDKEAMVAARELIRRELTRKSIALNGVFLGGAQLTEHIARFITAAYAPRIAAYERVADELGRVIALLGEEDLEICQAALDALEAK